MSSHGSSGDRPSGHPAHNHHWSPEALLLWTKLETLCRALACAFCLALLAGSSQRLLALAVLWNSTDAGPHAVLRDLTPWILAAIALTAGALSWRPHGLGPMTRRRLYLCNFLLAAVSWEIAANHHWITAEAWEQATWALLVLASVAALGCIDASDHRTNRKDTDRNERVSNGSSR